MALKKELYFKLEDVDGEFKLVYGPFVQKIYLNDVELKRSGRQGYEVTTRDGEIEYFKIVQDFTFSHIVEFRGEKTMLEEKLTALEYIIGGIPLVLVFAGGLIGGVFGMIGVTFNYGYMRQHNSLLAKIGVSLLITLVALAFYLLFATFINMLIFGTSNV